MDDYVAHVIEIIEKAAFTSSNGKVVLVAHSMGGIVITAVAERIPEKISKLVYLCAFMTVAGRTAAEYIISPENEGEMVGPQMIGNPAVIGASRIDHMHSDPACRARTVQAFFGDLYLDEQEAACKLLTPDVPSAPFATTVTASPERWGSVERHYVMCTLDMAIRPRLQRLFINEADALTPDNKTIIHTLNSSHSPFLSSPVQLAAILTNIVERAA